MADNINVTPGTGATVRSIDKSSKLSQVVVLDLGGAGAESLLTTSMPIQDGGNTITVDGTVAVTNAGITTIAGAVAGTEMQCDVLTMPVTHVIADSGTVTAVTSITNAVAVTNAGITTIAGAVSGTKMLVTADAITGTVTANAGTNLNTSALATETGGNLAAAATSLAIIDDWDSSDHCNIRHLTATDDTTNIVIPPSTTRVQGKCDNADTTTAREVVAAVASNYVYITSFVISVAAAGNYWLEDGDAAQLTPKFYLAANGGVSWTAAPSQPYKTTTVNKAINVKGSTAGAVGVMLVGYTSTT